MNRADGGVREPGDASLSDASPPKTKSSAVPLARPVLGEAEERAVIEVLRSGHLSLGPRVPEFERRFAQRLRSSGQHHANTGDPRHTRAGALRDSTGPHRTLIKGSSSAGNTYPSIRKSTDFATRGITATYHFEAPGRGTAKELTAS